MGIIRLLLAIAVLNSHFTFMEVPIVGGHEAVLAFFAISGFYMALILDANYASAKNFYMGRFLSLYPMYVFALTVSIALLITGDIHPMTGLDQLRSFLSDPLAFFLMLWTSACVLGQELLFSIASSPEAGLHFVTASKHGIWTHAPLIQAWSLSLEILFYALAPLLVRLSSRSLIGLVAVSIAAKFLVMSSSYADVVFFKRFFPIEFWLFGSGIIAYRFYRTLAPDPGAIDYFAFFFLVGFIFVVGDVDEALKPFILPVATLLTLPFVFRAFQALQLDRSIGKISYPFYLLHFSVIALFEEYWDDPTGWHILVSTLVVATLVHFIFNPGIEHFKQRIRRHAQPSFNDKLTVQPTIQVIKP